MDVLAKSLFSARFHPAAPRIPAVLAGIYYAAPSAQPLYNYLYEPLEIQQYLQGAGLGYAKPAELNDRLRRYEAQPVGNYHGNVFRRSSR